MAPTAHEAQLAACVKTCELVVLVTSLSISSFKSGFSETCSSFSMNPLMTYNKLVLVLNNVMAETRWKHIVYNKDITEKESLDFYSTWAEHVKPFPDNF